MTIPYKSLWLVVLIWCCQELNCQDGRSFISWNNLKNNEIDLHNHKDVQSSRTPNQDVHLDNSNIYFYSVENSNLNNLIEPISNPLNPINHNSNNNFLRKRRSVQELIKTNDQYERNPSDKNSNKTYEEALKWLDENNRMMDEILFLDSKATWNYESNLTEENKKLMLELNLKMAKFKLETYKNATSFNWKEFNDTLVKRRFEILTGFNPLVISEEKFNKMNQIINELLDIYSKAKICSFKSKTDCNLRLEPDLELILEKSRDYEELKHVFVEWRNKTGKKMRSKYLKLVELMNEQAKKNGFSSAEELWKKNFEIEGNDRIEYQLEEQFKLIKPMYELIHAFIRKKYREFYGSDRIKADGPIPAHILGNMWAQDWSQTNLDILLPYPKCVKKDISKILKERNLTEIDIFKISESFFVSIGLPKLPEIFWKNSIFKKPKDVELVCHASAWDVDLRKNDVRIKQCTNINYDDFLTAHHELGHIYYYLSYSHLPEVFRHGANPGFHEAIGDSISLSLQSRKHLKAMGLMENEELNKTGNLTHAENSTDACKEDHLNFLMSTALKKVVFLPFSYLIDKYRWNIFNGKIKQDQLNKEFWKLIAEYQGICPPVLRTEDDFDAGSKFHVASNIKYVSYFFSTILQFQFHKYLCDAAGEKGKLAECDIYGSKEAGKRLEEMMLLGRKKPWNQALEVISNGKESKLNASAILEYFEPLIDWLKKDLKNETIGWKIDNPNICPNH